MVDVQAKPSGARFVALGMLLSKLGGLVREMILARFFGVGPHADVFRSAMRAPNALQNLLGEQTLSAAFIPFYSRLLAEGRREEAGRFAGAVFGLLVAVVSLLVIVGVVLAPVIVSVLAAGFAGDAVEVAAGQRTVDRHALTVQAVRLVFPMTGFLVLSAWALGVLNSHRRFLLPYLSPLVWNASIVTALLWSAQGADLFAGSLGTDIPVLDRWLLAACGGALVGGFLQFAVQLPLVLRLTRGLRVSLSLQVEGVADALRAVGPALAGRGVVQLSIYVDLFLASWLADGALAAIGYATMLINLPLAAFGMSVAAAELPELASAGSERPSQEISGRINRALRQSVLALAPSVAGYLVFGVLVSGLLFRGGGFTLEANLLVYAVLCAYTLGLLASATSRLLQNVFFALHDTRTPARIAGVRLATSALLGAAAMFALDDVPVRAVFDLSVTTQDLRLGAVGLGLAASGGAWCELALLRRALRRRLPDLRLPLRHIVGRLGLAFALAVPALILWVLISSAPFVLQALVVLPFYAGSYLGWAWWRRFPELRLWHSRLGR